jgi:hypothetical protein
MAGWNETRDGRRASPARWFNGQVDGAACLPRARPIRNQLRSLSTPRRGDLSSLATTRRETAANSNTPGTGDVATRCCANHFDPGRRCSWRAVKKGRESTDADTVSAPPQKAKFSAPNRSGAARRPKLTAPRTAHPPQRLAQLHLACRVACCCGAPEGAAEGLIAVPNASFNDGVRLKSDS